MTPTGYDAATRGLSLFDRGHRARLRIAGSDRARFLHNLCTNDVKRLEDGSGCEAFITSPQGKTLGFVTLLARADHILLRTDPGGLVEVLPHLAKYGVFDDVTVVEETPSCVELHLVGPRAEELLGRLGCPAPAEGPYRHSDAELGAIPVVVVREAPTGRPGVTLLAPSDSVASLLGLLRDEGSLLDLVELDGATWEALRIEGGTPVFGRDVTPANLPQEVGRDRQAISFVKGCYLGQETVARIDALGHVNKLLRGLLLEPGTAPEPGAALTADGKPVGSLTSVAFSSGWGAAVALGYVRMSHAAVGTELRTEGGTATVRDLPMLPSLGSDRT
jgi:folate-binding protein YgfZ